MSRFQAQQLLFTGPGKAKAKRLPPVPEAEISGAVKKLLSVHRGVAWSTRCGNASGYFVDAGTMRAIIQALGGPETFKARFGRARWMSTGGRGVSDFVGQLRDGRTLAVEAKACRYSPGQVSADQRRFLALVNENGGLGVVVSDVSRLNNVLSGLAEAEMTEDGYYV